MMDFCDSSLLPRVEGATVVLADGMSTYDGGLIAAKEATEAALRSLIAAETLDKSAIEVAFKEANCAVGQAQARNDEYKLMGTTLVVAAVAASKVFVGHLGDSRATLFRKVEGGWEVRRLTQDHLAVIREHNLPNDVGIKSNPLFYEESGALDRCVGRGEVAPDFYEFEVCEGDRIVLYSDGITEYVPENEMAGYLMDPPSKAAEAIVKRAIRRESDDHCSVAVLEVAASS
jgi:protein phosphatase